MSVGSSLSTQHQYLPFPTRQDVFLGVDLRKAASLVLWVGIIPPATIDHVSCMQGASDS